MNREKLIAEVQKHPYLYDSNDSKYNDAVRKEKAWKTIGSVLKQPETQCKKVWLNIRESHRRFIKKKKRHGMNKRWIYENEMMFMLPHIRERPTPTMPSDTTNDDDQDLDENSISSNEDSQYSYHVQPESSEAGLLLDPSKMAYTTASFSNDTYMSQTRKKIKTENSSTSAELINFLIDQKNKEKRDDEIDKFFKSISATVKKFTEQNQAIIKNKIFEFVSETEMKELEERQNNARIEDSKENLDEPPEPEPEPERFVRCSRCNEAVTGFVFVCVQCNVRVCGACDAQGHHAQHYVLRAPPGSPESEVQLVVDKVREGLIAAGHQVLTNEADNAKTLELEIEITKVKTEADMEGDPLGSVHCGDLFAAVAAGSQVVPEQTEIKTEPPDTSLTRQESASFINSPASTPRQPPGLLYDESQPPAKRRNVSSATSTTYPSHTPLKTLSVLPLSTPDTWLGSTSNADPGFAADPGIPSQPETGPHTRMK